MTKSKEMSHTKVSQSNIFTKKCIITAFFELLENNDFDKITITDIINKAGVSRMGFYRNYESKEDMLYKFIGECFDETINNIISAKEIDLSITKIMEITLEYFQHYSHYVKLLIDRNHQFLIYQAYQKAFYSLYGFKDTRIGRYSTEMFIGELFLLELEWVRSGMIETPAELAKIYYKILKLRLSSRLRN